MDDLFEHVKKLDDKYVMQTYKRLPVAFVKGEGTRLWDSSGRSYLDLVGGLGVTVLGHSHPAVVAAIHEQASKIIHTTNLYYVEPQADDTYPIVRVGSPLCDSWGVYECMGTVSSIQNVQCYSIRDCVLYKP